MSKKQTYHKTTAEIENEYELIKKAKKNPQHFAPLYDLYYLQIFKYVIKGVKDQNDAAEITSDVFAKAMFKIDTYKFKGVPFGSWLHQVARNEMFDYYSRNQSDKFLRATEKELNGLNDHIDNSEDEITSKSNKEEKISQIITSLEILHDDDLELIEMRFFEERSFKEMAEILNLTEGNARTKTHRAINKLKNNIKS